MRSTGKLLIWDSPAATGVANKASLRANRFAVMAVLELWVSASDAPKSPPIGWLRAEAGVLHDRLHTPIFFKPSYLQVKQIHQMLTATPSIVNQYVDDWGCKRLTSWCIRRFRTGQGNFRDTVHPHNPKP